MSKHAETFPGMLSHARIMKDECIDANAVKNLYTRELKRMSDLQFNNEINHQITELSDDLLQSSEKVINWLRKDPTLSARLKQHNLEVEAEEKVRLEKKQKDKEDKAKADPFAALGLAEADMDFKGGINILLDGQTKRDTILTDVLGEDVVTDLKDQIRTARQVVAMLRKAGMQHLRYVASEQRDESHEEQNDEPHEEQNDEPHKERSVEYYRASCIPRFTPHLSLSMQSFVLIAN